MRDVNVPFVSTTNFDASNFSSTAIPVEPAQDYYGIQEKSLPYPGQTSDTMVVQDFKPTTKGWTNKTITANVMGFKTTLDCEQVNITTPIGGYWPWIQLNTPIFVADIVTPSCIIHNFTLAVGPHFGDVFYIEGATETYLGSYGNYTCNMDYDNTGAILPSHEPNADTRLVLSMAHVTWPKDLNGTTLYVDDVKVRDSTVLLCKASYSLDTYEVSFEDNTQSEKNIEMTIGAAAEDPKNLTGLYNQDLITAVQASFNNGSDLFGTGGEDAVIWEVLPFFNLMAQLNNNSRQEAFMDPAVLSKYGRKVFEGLMTLIAKDYLMINTNNTLTGEIQFLENRLHVKKLTVILMGIILGLLVVTSVLVMFLRPRNVVPTRPDNVGGIASILRYSPEFQKTLKDSGYARMSAVRHQTSSMRFQTIQTQQTTETKGKFYIEIVESSEVSLAAPPKKFPEMKWWLPMGSKLLVQLVIVLVPLVAIAALEIIQQLSDKDHGFASISTKSSVDPELLISYVPALIMLIIATLYTTLDFAVGTLSPYHALKRGNSPAAKSINVSILNRIPPHALYIALRSGYWAACFTVMAGFLSSFLSIIVSGLYTIEAVPTTMDLIVQQSDSFVLTQGDLSVDDREAGTTTSLLLYQNLSYPQWTYGDLVFPEVSIPASINLQQNYSATTVSEPAKLTVTVPALRASLNCTTVSDEVVPSVYPVTQASEIDGIDFVAGTAYAAYNVPVPWTCDSNSNVTSANWTTYIRWPLSGSQAYFGTAGILQWFVEDDVAAIGDTAGMDGATLLDGALDIGGPGCASFGILFGSQSSENTIIANSTAVKVEQSNEIMAMCKQYIQEVQTNLTLILPDLTIDTSNPPVTIESTATYLHNGTQGTDWQFPVAILLNAIKDLGSTGNNVLSPFIQALIYGEDGIPLEELEAADGSGIPKLYNASSKLYGKYMAQAINLNMRNTSTADGQSLASYGATISDPFTQRIRQNRASKLVLQIVLAAMTLCGIIAHLTMNPKALLPNNPCSIVGVAKLLADSDMCGLHDNAVRTKKGATLDGWFFSLGWWGAREAGNLKPGEGRRFGIDIGLAEKASEKAV